jgi:hypothetical protein
LRPLQQFPPEDAMISFLAVLLLSFATLCAGTYLADWVERRHCAVCGLVADTPERADN